jgi:hypothetical protein
MGLGRLLAVRTGNGWVVFSVCCIPDLSAPKCAAFASRQQPTRKVESSSTEEEYANYIRMTDAQLLDFDLIRLFCALRGRCDHVGKEKARTSKAQPSWRHRSLRTK